MVLTVAALPKVKFMKSKPGAAMVEMADGYAVDRAITHLNNNFMFGQKLKVWYVPTLPGEGCIGKALRREGKDNGAHSGQRPREEHREAVVFIQAGVGMAVVPRYSPETVGESQPHLSCGNNALLRHTALGLSKNKPIVGSQGVENIRSDKGFHS